MVKYNNYQDNDHLSLIFQSLADPTRRKILKRLTTHSLTVTEIAEPYDMSLPAISKHIKILEKARLIFKEKKGREHTVHLQAKTLKTVEEYIHFYSKFWNKQLDNLEKFLLRKDSERR